MTPSAYGPVIARETPDQPDVRALLDAADSRSAALYPARGRHGLSVEQLLAQQARLFVARFFVTRTGGEAVGCGGFVLTGGGTAELKRMFVVPAARRQGVARGLLEGIEAAAEAEGVRLMRLETGVRSDEALALYERAHYVRCDPFPPYGPDPLSVFMAKTLAVAAEEG